MTFADHIESKLEPSFNGKQKKRNRVDVVAARRMADTAEANRHLSNHELYRVLYKQEYPRAYAALALIPFLLAILPYIPSIWFIIQELRKFF